MRKILFLFLFTYLFSFDSNKIDTTILTTTSHHAIINQKIKAGMSGYVIQNGMMIAKAVSLGDGNVKYLPLTKLQNTALATPKVMPKNGDHIIFGLYNFRGLIIAPNQETYTKTKNKYPNINFINSDIFASYFTTKPEISDFQSFCRDFNVGIIDFILDKEYIVDCESFVILDEKNTTSTKYTKPFFVNYKSFTNAFFSSIPKSWIKYYKSLLKASNGK
jgi:hypothetical protein